MLRHASTHSGDALAYADLARQSIGASSLSPSHAASAGSAAVAGVSTRAAPAAAADASSFASPSFLPMHLLPSPSSSSSSSRQFDAASLGGLDLTALEGHVRLHVAALERSRAKFLAQFATVAGVATIALGYYLYSLTLSDAPSESSLLAFGFCSVLLLLSIASGLFHDRLHGKEKYVASMNRWLSLFGVQWKSSDEGEAVAAAASSPRRKERLVLELLPVEVARPAHSRRRSSRGSSSSICTAAAAAAAAAATSVIVTPPALRVDAAESEYDARRRVGIESGWIHTSPLAANLSAVTLGSPALSTLAEEPTTPVLTRPRSASAAAASSDSAVATSGAAAFEPIAQPLRRVLHNVLHANLFSSRWRSDLMAWLLDNADQAPAFRRQFARAALTDTVDPAELRAVGGHSESPREWFTQRYTEYYGRAPRPADYQQDGADGFHLAPPLPTLSKQSALTPRAMSRSKSSGCMSSLAFASLTSDDAKFLQSSVLSPDLGEKPDRASLAAMEPTSIDDEAAHQMSERDRVLQVIKRSKSAEFD